MLGVTLTGRLPMRVTGEHFSFLKIPIIGEFAARCRGKALACLGMNAFMPVIANASPLRFQKTKVLRKISLHISND